MSDFSQNLQRLRDIYAPKNQEAFGQWFGISRTDVNRLLQGSRDPTRQQLRAIADRFKIDPDDLLLPQAQFAQLISKSDLPFASLRASKENKKRLQAFIRDRNLQGQYKLYYYSKGETEFIVSLLTIGRVSQHGVSIELINPYLGIPEGKLTAYEYAGYGYIVGVSTLYCWLERKEASDIWCLIAHIPLSPKPNTMRGVSTGIGVTDAKNFIAANPVLLKRIESKDEILNWRDELGAQLGYKKKSVHRDVEQALSLEKVRVES